MGIVALWLLIQLPLVYAGSWYGYHRSQPWEHPTKTNVTSRQVPEQAWYTNSIILVALAGLISFAVIFIELLFVFRSLWQDKSGYYYVFGFLSVVSVVLMVTIVEATIVATYIQLCAEVSSFCPRCTSVADNDPEPSLVVAILLRWRRGCLLDLHLLRVVLLHEAAHPRLYLRHAVLQLQFLSLYGIRFIDRYGWVSNGVCIRTAYLRVGSPKPQGGVLLANPS